MKKSGFTLVEIMIVIAIVSVISAGILTVSIGSLNAYYTVNTLNELNTNAAFAIDEMIRDISHSRRMFSMIDQVNDPAIGKLRSIMVLPLPGENVDADGNPVWTHAVVYYFFTTPDNIEQIRRYRLAGFSDTDLPLNAAVTLATINIFSDNGILLESFDRADDYEKVLANFISDEGFFGSTSFDGSGNTVFLNLFFKKPVTGIAGIERRDVSTSLRSTAYWRN